MLADIYYFKKVIRIKGGSFSMAYPYTINNCLNSYTFRPWDANINFRITYS